MVDTLLHTLENTEQSRIEMKARKQNGNATDNALPDISADHTISGQRVSNWIG